MLFNSYIFVLVFLPATLCIYYLMRRRIGADASFAFLALASFGFYAYWKATFLPILLASIVFNYLIGLSLQRSSRATYRKWILIAGLAANLTLLGYYKYANFFVSNVEALIDRNLVDLRIVLPLAISFFTFQQIAYLVDVYKGRAREYSFVHYCLFIAFFPQLIAGPIVHHSEILPQFLRQRATDFDVDLFRAGVFLFVVGLAKKVLIADTVALYSTPVFSAADSGVLLTPTEAWVGLLAYTFQIYFDFSGYSDMALGLAAMFGIRLPENFRSPYKARSISDFWRRWHITLSRFLRDYLYVPLGGNRKGGVRRHINLMATMLLGGLWHGASWNFVLWGGLHGIYLVLNHAWSAAVKRAGLQKMTERSHYKAVAWGVTFLAVVLAWVPFRSETVSGVISLYSSLFDITGFTTQQFSAKASEHISNMHRAFAMLTICLGIAIGLPNSQEWVKRLGEKALEKRYADTRTRMKYVPMTVSVFLALTLVASLCSMNRVSEFLYFQF